MRYSSFVIKILLAGLFFCLFSCGSNKSEIAAFRELNESLERSNEIITDEILKVQQSFKNLLADPKTSEIAQRFYPRMERVILSTDSLYNFLDSVKTQIEKSDKPTVKGKFVYSRIAIYQSHILGMDTIMSNEVSDILTRLDSNPQKHHELFENLNAFGKISILTGLQNKIRIIERNMVHYLNSQSCRLPIIYDEYQAFAGLNSTYVQAGEQVELFAGIGAFTKDMVDEILVNGKPVGLNRNGVAEFNFKAPSMPGKYHINAVIKFTNKSGVKQIISRKIEYTVAKKCN